MEWFCKEVLYENNARGVIQGLQEEYVKSWG